ncbi:bromodomain-containing protein [Drosophila madeirensis]|uniref:Bromodomain-containing protein n=1 Tax=Drosophila madeirensis TaxID=30013 RepID=A0AAU9GCM3_DROMD
METIEFLSRTSRRNLKSQIGWQVAQRMRQWSEDLDDRRMQLYVQLQNEALQVDEEVAELLRLRADEAERQRHEWIHMERLKREEAEQELLKVKQQQREIENSEAHRHMQIKQILWESKQAQLQQIEDRRALKRRQACVEILWQRVWQRLDESREQQQQYEQQLRRLLEGQCQTENLARDQQQKRQLQQQVLQEQRECAEALEVAAANDVRKREMELQQHQAKRRQQLTDLQAQIQQNLRLTASQAADNQREDVASNMREDRQIYEELMQKQCDRALNRDWHQQYMTHTAAERAAHRQGELERERAYLGTGCVLGQRPKQPYGRAVR